MPRFRVLLAAALLLVLPACGSNDSAPFPDAVISSVTPTELAPGAEFSITGGNYYAIRGLGGTRIDVCGVTLSGVMIDPLTRNILLPPGAIITAQVGNMLTGTLPTEGFTTGPSGVRLTRPDGSSAVLHDAVTCVDPGIEPDPVPVTAVITASSATGVAPATLAFNAAGSTGEGELDFGWDFGVAGATASGADVSYEYLQPGAYTVKLTVTDETGAEATATQQVTVHPALQAVIQHGEISSYAPVSVAFDATGSTGIAPLTYEWSFGDGTAASSEAGPEHEFTTGGNYIITLTVTDADGETDSAQVELVIEAPTPVNAVITADAVTGTAPLTVNVSALDSSGEGDLHFAWDFGVPGATSEEAEAPFSFLVGGTYTVMLTVTDETGAAHVASQTIKVEAQPASLSFVTEPAGLNPDSVVSVTGDGFSEAVTLPDGTLSLPPGEYTVTPAQFELVEMVAGEEVISKWDAPPQTVTLAEGEVRTLTLDFEPANGQLEVTFNGLPVGDHLDAVTVTPLHTPLGLTADTSDLSQLLPGVYEVTFANVRIQHDGWAAEYESMQTSVEVVVSSGQVAEVQAQYELQPSLGLEVQFSYPEVQLPFTLTGVNGSYNQNNATVPPGEYTLTLRPVDYVNEAGQNGVSPTFERWTPVNSEHAVRLSSNEASVIEPPYSMRNPVIRFTVTAPTGAVNFRADVAINGPNRSIIADGTVSGQDEEAEFGRHCVVASRTYYFDVGSTDIPGTTSCFNIDTTPDYRGIYKAYPVRVNYRPRRVTFPDHPDGTAAAGTIRYAYNIDEWFITTRMEVGLEVDGVVVRDLTWLAPSRYQFQGTGTFEATAGTRVRVRVDLWSQGVMWGVHYSPYLEIGP